MLISILATRAIKPVNDIPLGFLTHWEFSVLPAHNAGIKGGAHVAPFFFIVLPNIKTSARLLVIGITR